MDAALPLIGAVEGGGTKFVCAVARKAGDWLAQEVFRTREPEVTLAEVAGFFERVQGELGPLRGLGIGCFGPLDLDEDSGGYGHITTTPKPGWQGVDLVGYFRRLWDVPIGFDTDVNGAVLGEARYGAGQGCDPLVYVTVGTGVGGGVLVNGRPLHGLVHPEIGHLLVPPLRDGDGRAVRGSCPFHECCVEGYACGPAIEKRWGVPAGQLAADSPAWVEVAEVLGAMCVNLTVTLSPKKIILGGGVMKQAHLPGMVRAAFGRLLNDYVLTPATTVHVERFIVSPGLGDVAGLFGAWELGRAVTGEV